VKDYHRNQQRLCLDPTDPAAPGGSVDLHSPPDRNPDHPNGDCSFGRRPDRMWAAAFFIMTIADRRGPASLGGCSVTERGCDADRRVVVGSTSTSSNRGAPVPASAAASRARTGRRRSLPRAAWWSRVTDGRHLDGLRLPLLRRALVAVGAGDDGQ